MRLLLSLLTLAAALAQEPPDAPGAAPGVSLESLDGRTVPLRSVLPPGRKVLIYVALPNQEAARLIKFTHLKDPGAPRPRLVIIFDPASASELPSFLDRFPWISRDDVYLDPGQQAFRHLKFDAAPVAAGLDGAVERWRLVGTGAPLHEIESLLRKWGTESK